MFVTLALSDIDFVALERPTPNKSKSPLCVKRRILKLYKYYTPACRLQISSFVIIGFSAVSVDHCLSVEHPPKDGHTNPTRHYIFQQLPGNDSWPFGDWYYSTRLLTWSAIHSTFKRVHGSVRLRPSESRTTIIVYKKNFYDYMYMVCLNFITFLKCILCYL